MSAEPASARPEHRELDRLVGTWDVRSQWQVTAGDGWHHGQGTAENRWILGGRVLESTNRGPDGAESSRTFFAFDCTAGDYVAFSLTVLSTFYVLERGPFDPLGPALVFEGSEALPGMDGAIRFHRTLTFVDPSQYTLGITYPDHPEGTFGGMFIEHHRTGA